METIIFNKDKMSLSKQNIRLILAYYRMTAKGRGRLDRLVGQLTEIDQDLRRTAPDVPEQGEMTNRTFARSLPC